MSSICSIEIDLSVSVNDRKGGGWPHLSASVHLTVAQDSITGVQFIPAEELTSGFPPISFSGWPTLRGFRRVGVFGSSSIDAADSAFDYLSGLHPNVKFPFKT